MVDVTVYAATQKMLPSKWELGNIFRNFIDNVFGPRHGAMHGILYTCDQLDKVP